MSAATRRLLAYGLLLLLPTLAVGGAAILLLRKEQARLVAQQATVGEARRAAVTARAALIVENTELLVGDVQTALLDSLAQMPASALETELDDWEKGNPLVRTAWRCTPGGRLLRPAANVADEEALAFRRRFAPLLEQHSPWRLQSADSQSVQLKAVAAPAPAASEDERVARQQAYTNVSKVQAARREAKLYSARNAAETDAAAPALARGDFAGPAQGVALADTALPRAAKDQAQSPRPERRGWTPLVVDGRLHLLGWVEAGSENEVRGLELELSALVGRLGGVLPDEILTGEGYALRDEKGRIMHQVGWVPRDGGAPDLRLPLSAAMLPGWEVVAFLAPAYSRSSAESGFFLLGSLLVGILVVAILAGGSLLAVQARRSEAEAAQKTSFVANVSHEFKTPLTTIRLYTELLEQGRVQDPAKQRDYLQTIGRETQRLARLVGNALDFSRLEQGQKKYVRERLDLTVELNRLLATHAPRLAESGLALRPALPSAGVEVLSDRDAIEQIVLNLLDNAAKYAAEGGEVAVELEARPAGGAVVRVLDRGPGIPGDQREKIFEKFHRVDDSLTAEKGGTGLGLSIARQLARGLGGDVRHEPRPGGGAAFILELP